MSILSENLRYLRTKRDLSQQRVADDLIITRARYSKYEEAASEPPLLLLQQLARYFYVSIDLLLAVDLRRVPMDSLVKLDGNRILLPITVDKQGENFIEVIPYTAKAGYLTGYADAEFIENLPQFSFPFLKEGKHRAFPIEGDSMPPHRDGDYVIGRFIEDKGDVQQGSTYIIMTMHEGMSYKRVKLISENTYTLQSDNTFYEAYEVQHSDILEIWKFAGSFTTREFKPDMLNHESISGMFRELKKEIGDIKIRIK